METLEPRGHKPRPAMRQNLGLSSDVSAVRNGIHLVRMGG